MNTKHIPCVQEMITEHMYTFHLSPKGHSKHFNHERKMLTDYNP